MRSFFRWLFIRPVLWTISRFTSAPDQRRVFSSLTELLEKIQQDPGKKGFIIPFDAAEDRFILFSDQHKGRRNGADDFLPCEPAYLAALDYYDRANFHLLCLGDCEELWENTVLQVMHHHQPSFEAEKKFALRNAYTKLFGNHDLDWEIDPLSPVYLKKLYKTPMAALEAVALQTRLNGELLTILCTHGHQGDKQSDGNWFSKFFISKVWAPFQAFLRINPNTPAYDKHLKTLHNRMMFEWSSQYENLMLITGHTHQPVFESLTRYERLLRDRKKALEEHNAEWAQALENEMAWRRKEDQHAPHHFTDIKPSYFNTGCCCYDDGDITGIEIADQCIRLVQWKNRDNRPGRLVLEEKRLDEIAVRLKKKINVIQLFN